MGPSTVRVTVPTTPRPEVRVSVRGGARGALPSRTVRTWAVRMLRALELDSAELSVLLTDNDEIHALNRTYRDQDKPTDVLAFAMREGEPMGAADEPELLGDVIISIPYAEAQAKKRGRPLDREVTTLLAHGLLHLIGFDHRTPAQMRTMTAKTRFLCAAARSEEGP